MNTPEHDAAAVRRLARGLVLDGGDRADAVQEAWLAALRRGRNGPPSGGWLAGAVRRISLGRRRDEARRRRRESATARDERDHAAEGVPERLEVLRALLAALERLDEPYRAAVVMRYLDDLPPREIARRTGVPVDTARTHVRRGLERLRADLDGPRGPGREALLGALAPWFTGPEGVSLAVSTGLAWMGGMAVKKVLGATLAILGVAIGWVLLRDPVEPRVPVPPAHIATGAALADPDPVGIEAPGKAQETVAPDPPGRVPVDSQRSYEVAGVILRGSEVPLPFGHVRLRVQRGAGLEGEVLEERRLQAGEDGTFRCLLDAPSEPVTVSLVQDEPRHVGHRTWAAVGPLDEPWGTWMVPAYPLDVDVTGLVVDERDQPLPDALIVHTVYLADREVRTDASGRFRIALSSAAEHNRLVVRSPGCSEVTVALAPLEAGEVELQPIRLAAVAPISGRVVDSAGVPVAGALVRDRRALPVARTSTGDDGRFSIDGPRTERDLVLLEVEHPEYVKLQSQSAPDKVELELRLERGFTIHGVVRDPSGTSVAGAWLRLGTGSSPHLDRAFLSDDQGRFSIEQRSSGTAHLWIWAEGHAGQRVPVFAPTDGSEQAEVTVTLEPERVLRGRLLLPDGSPRAWGMVYVEDHDPMRRNLRFDSLQVWSDAEGRFSVRGLPGGSVVAGAYVTGFERVEIELPEVTDQEIELRLRRAGGLAGRVVDAATGAPVTTFRVRAQVVPGPDGSRTKGGLSTTWSERGVEFSDADGRWDLGDGDLSPDAWLQVEVEAAGYAPGKLDPVPVATQPDHGAHVIALARSTRVFGRVVDADGGPIVGARILPAADERDASRAIYGREPREQTLTDAAGDFAFEDLPTGSLRLVVLAEGFPITVEGPFEVLGVAATRRDIALARGGVIRGRLLDADGRALAGEPIGLSVLEGVAQAQRSRTRTDERGAFAFEGLAPGLHHLAWMREHAGRELNDHLRLVEVTGDEAVEVDLAPRGTATVRGRVVFDGPTPAVEVVRVHPFPRPGDPPPASRYAPSGRGAFVLDGEFAFDGLEAGHHSFVVSMWPDDGPAQMGSTRLDLVDGEHAEIEIVLRSLDRAR